MSPSGKGALRIAIEDFIETFHISELIKGGIKTWAESLEHEALDQYQNLLGDLGIESQLPAVLSPERVRARVLAHQTGIGEVGAILIGLLFGVLGGASRPVANVTGYKVERVVKSFRVDPGTATTVIARDPVLKDQMIEDMKDQGLDDLHMTAVSVALRPVIPGLQLEQLRRKGAITDADFQSLMRAQLYDTAGIERVQKLFEVIPNVSDLIRLAVREAFSPDVVERFKYGEAFPAEVSKWTEAQGLSEEWAKRYWYAHWELPSIQQGFEMFQRLRPGRTDVTFTDEDLDLLMRTADIAPYFRTRLKEIAYQPLTRVDVRRMFGQGVMNESQVYEAYRDLGYNEVNAKFLTDFTVRFERQTERGLTREVIQSSYKRGLTSRTDAITSLAELGYPEDIADYYLDVVDFDLAQEQTDAKLEAIHTQFVSGGLDESTVMDKLGPLNLPSDRQTALLELWAVQKGAKISLPSRSELDDLYRRALITTDEYSDFLKKDGYRQEVIDLYAKRISMIIAEDAKIEASTAQAEQERLSKATRASTYQKDAADLDVQIAEDRLAIADRKVAIFDIEDPDQVAAVKREIVELQADIVSKQLEKSKLTLTFRTGSITPGV